MDDLTKSQLHPLENAGALESRLRYLLQNPNRILRKYLYSGMTVLDLGCGTGYFTTEIAKIVGDSGKVIAVDVQEKMLEILKQKLRDNEVHNNIQIIKCQENHLGLTEKVDFILAFYTFHEMKYIDNIITELKTILKPKAKILISEQKFHVPRLKFDTIINKMTNQGFVICERPNIFLSRTVIMECRKRTSTVANNVYKK